MKELSEAARLSERIRKTRPANTRSILKRRLVAGTGVNDADYIVGSGGAGRDLCPAYSQWKCILRRCYDQYRQERDPAYIGCSVDSRWHSFMAFRSWWVLNHRDGWHIDKDFISPELKVYGPDTCCTVPSHINSFLTSSGAKRGKNPIGVCFQKRSGKFSAQCCNGSGKQVTIGLFDSPSDAHIAWRRFKLEVLEDLRAEMDAIDPRIYVSAKAKILAHAPDVLSAWGES